MRYVAIYHTELNRGVNLKKQILDVCCGSKMFHFDKHNPLIHFNDIRNESYPLCDGRFLDIEPDTSYDFKNLPFDDNQFNLVIFDPPHLMHIGNNSWMAKKYGKLDESTWQETLHDGFKESYRVLAPGGTLIFKWCDSDISISDILKIVNVQPVIGDRSRTGNSIWLVFYKNI